MTVERLNRITCSSCGDRHEWESDPPTRWLTLTLQRGLPPNTTAGALVFHLCEHCGRELTNTNGVDTPTRIVNLKEHIGSQAPQKDVSA